MGCNRVREEQVAEPFGTLETARAVTACARSGGKRSVVAVVILRCNRVREEQVTTTPRNAEKRGSDRLREE